MTDLTESQMSLENTIGELTDEIQKLKSNRDKLAYDLGVADVKNGELLRLLKECKRLLKEYNYTFPTNDFEKSDKLLTKIEEVLMDD